jgi:hypothetical protein
LLSLRCERLGQTEGLGIPLAPDDQVAGPDVAGEVN